MGKIFAITGSGLQETRSGLYLEAGSLYYLQRGEVLVTSVSADRITFGYTNPEDGKDKISTHSDQRAIIESLMIEYTQERLKQYGKYMSVALKKTLEDNLEGKRGQLNGKFTAAMFDRVVVTCRANSKTTDLYGQTKAYGVLTQFNEQDQTSEIEVQRRYIQKMRKDPGFDVIKVR